MTAVAAADAAAPPAPPRAAILAAFAAVYFLWGATFLALRYAVAEVPPLFTIAVRCAGGAAILYGWLAARGQLARGSAAEWRTAAAAGALLFVGCHALLAVAERRVSSGHASLVMASIPLWLVVLGAARERKAPTVRVMAGLTLGVAGVAVLTAGARSAPAWSWWALGFGAFAWAAGSLVARHGARPESAAQSTAMQLAAGAVWLTAASAASGELAGWSPAHVSMRAGLAMVFLVVCGTVIAFGAYTWLLRVVSPAAAGSYAFVNPVVALGLGWAVGDDVITPRVAVAAALVVLAVALTIRAGARAAPRR